MGNVGDGVFVFDNLSGSVSVSVSVCERCEERRVTVMLMWSGAPCIAMLSLHTGWRKRAVDIHSRKIVVWVSNMHRTAVYLCQLQRELILTKPCW